MANPPLVTVGIPNFNGERFISQAIYSILNQTYKNIELIVIDNNSTDRSFGIITNITDHRLRSIRNETNIGMTPNWNKCIKGSAPVAEYILIMSSDDFLHPNYIEDMVTILEQNPDINYGYCRTTLVNSNNKPFYTEKTFKIKSQILEQFYHLDKCSPSFGSMIVRKSILDKIGVYDETDYPHGADGDLAMRLIIEGRGYYLHKKYFFYRVTNTSSSTVDHKEDDFSTQAYKRVHNIFLFLTDKDAPEKVIMSFLNKQRKLTAFMIFSIKIIPAL